MRKVFTVFGPQGSGKSTQVERLAERYNCAIFEAGAQLRERAKVDENIHQMQNTGVLVPGAVLRHLVEDFIENLPSNQGIVFDGYPRSEEQYQDFVELANQGNWRVTVVYIELSDQSALKRLSTRFQLIDGRKVYREDDKPDVVAKRLQAFKSQTLPIKDLLAKNYQLVIIDGEPPVDEVTSAINSAVDNLLNE